MNTVKPVDKLFQLIQQLTRAEKRNYSIYAQQNTSQADKPQHLIVFESINKNKISDYLTLAQYFKQHKAIYKRLSQVKKYLYNDILDFLVFSQRKSLFQNTYSLLRNKVLLQRGMKEAVIKNCKQEISRIQDLSDYQLGIEYLTLLLNSQAPPYSTKEITGFLLQLNRQRANYSTILSKYYQYVYLKFECVTLMGESIRAKLENNQVLLAEVTSKAVYLLEEHALLKLGLKPKVLGVSFVYFQCLFSLFKLLNRHEEALLFFKEQYDKVITSNLKDEDKNRMMSLISGYLAELYACIDDLENFKHFIELHKYYSKQINRPEVALYYFYFIKHLHYAVEKQRYNLILDIDSELRNYLAKAKNLPADPRGSLHFLHCGCFFGLQDYKKANEIASTYFSTIRPSGHEQYYTAFKLMYCMILITQQDYSIAKSECRSLLNIKRVKTNNLGYPIFKDIIKMLRVLIEHLINGNTNAVKKKYQELAKEIETLKGLDFCDTLFRLWIKHQMKNYH